MSTILYIKASPREERSYCAAVAEAFLDSCTRLHPEEVVKRLDLFKRSLPPFDLAAATAKYKIMHGKGHSPADREIWDEVVALIQEFKAADKYVFAVPMWNFSIPYRLKQYIDIIVQPGLTFSVDEKGNYGGLVTGKPVFVAYSRGGRYEPGSAAESFDLQRKYVELILRFIGFEEILSIVVEPTLAAGPDTAGQKRLAAIDAAKKMAGVF